MPVHQVRFLLEEIMQGNLMFEVLAASQEFLTGKKQS
jgi:hypothetical protein